MVSQVSAIELHPWIANALTVKSGCQGDHLSAAASRIVGVDEEDHMSGVPGQCAGTPALLPDGPAQTNGPLLPNGNAEPRSGQTLDVPANPAR